MKRIISTALAVSLLAGSALAQPPERGGRGGGDRGDRGGQAQGQRDFGGDRGGGDRGDRGGGDRGQPQQAPQQQAAPQPQAAPQQQPQAGPQPGRGSYLRSPADRRDEFRGGPNNGPNNGGAAPNRGPDNRGLDNNRGDRGPNNNGGNFRQDDRRGGPGFQGQQRPGQDFRNGGGQRQFRDRDRGRPQFDARRYRPSYRFNQRFRIGSYRAPPGFYARSWGFGDRLPFGWFGSSYYLNAAAYGLPYPPIGCEWVRVGSDALLVDVWSGEVLSVAYGLFW